MNEEENLVLANTNLDDGPIDPEREPRPCCSKFLTPPPLIVSPSSIFSRPKRIASRRCVRKKRTQRSEALTESSFKNELIKQMEEKKNEKKKSSRGKKENSKQMTGKKSSSRFYADLKKFCT